MRRPVATVLMLALVNVGLASAASPSPAMQAFLGRQAKLAAIEGRVAGSKAITADTIFVSDFEGDASETPQNCDADTDGDTLPDCAETNTGVYVDATDTGTDPNHSDTDRDGLTDGEEVMGALNGLNLPALGVNPLRRDLLVEYDWFDDDKECAAHSHAPTANVLARVRAAYAAAPVQNPDGSTGINVIQDAGQFGGGNLIAGHDANLPAAFDATHAQIKSANFDAKRQGYFHYVMMAHRYGGNSNSSGYGEIVGDDTIVSLYCLNTDNNVARTILHELGHNLGLDHGGFEACNGKPNYNSLMNYRYQFQGLDAQCSANGDGQTDGYSKGDRLSIDEADLDELQGVCGQPAIDWNRNGAVESGLALDLNPGQEATCGGESMSEMQDFDDWANITMLGTQDATGKLKGIKRETGCAGAPAH